MVISTLFKFLFEADGPRGEGTYHMHLYLQASNGNKVDAVGRVSDPVAPLSVNFPAEELKELGTDGSYRLTFISSIAPVSDHRPTRRFQWGHPHHGKYPNVGATPTRDGLLDDTQSATCKMLDRLDTVPLSSSLAQIGPVPFQSVDY